MRKNSDIPVGFKDSPLGIIPEEWHVWRLSNLCLNKGDYGLNAPASDYSDDLPTYLRITDINDDGSLCRDDMKSVDDPSAGNYLLNDGDIVFARTGATVGKTYMYKKSDGQLVYAGYLIKFSPDAKRLLPYYLKANTETGYYWNWVAVTSQRSGQPGINATEYCSLRIAVPTIKEQERICSVLQLWDEAIEKQTALIEKLRLRKRALMQQLLTGKKRLPGFTDKWKTVKLGDVCQMLHNVALSREQLNNHGGDIQNVHYGDILIKYPSVLDVDKTALPFVNRDVVVESNVDFLQDGDIIMSDTAEDETVGKACEIFNVKSRKILAGLHTMLIRPKTGDFAPCFLGYYLNSEIYHKQLMPLIQGIKVCSLGKHAIQNTILAIPSLEEQAKIVEILALCDAEIQFAIKKKAGLHFQKRGLMQQLLTGKKRI